MDIKKLRKQTAKALLVENLTLAEFGRILGYGGKNPGRTVQRIESGEAELSPLALRRASDLEELLFSDSFRDPVIPNWSYLISPFGLFGDGVSILAARLFFPRHYLAVTDETSAVEFREQGFRDVGSCENNGVFLVKYVDYLPDEKLYKPFVEGGLSFMVRKWDDFYRKSDGAEDIDYEEKN